MKIRTFNIKSLSQSYVATLNSRMAFLSTLVSHSTLFLSTLVSKRVLLQHALLPHAFFPSVTLFPITLRVLMLE